MSARVYYVVFGFEPYCRYEHCEEEAQALGVKITMRIGIDIRPAFTIGGAGTYTRELVRHLAKIDRESEYRLYTYLHHRLREKERDKIVDEPNFAHKGIFPVLPRISTDRFYELWDEIFIPMAYRLDKVDVIHFPNHLGPTDRVKCSLVTIHDLIFMKSKRWVKKGTRDKFNKRLLEVAQEAFLIIAISESTKKDIINLLGIPARKVRVVYEAASPLFRPLPKGETLEEVLRKYALNFNYILYVGQLQPRKNLRLLIEAFSSLDKWLREKYQLVLVGLPRDEVSLREIIDQAHKSGVEKNLHLLGFVPDEDLVYVYNGAEIFVYPSLFEGFGLPPLEAMSCGLPIISSNTSSLPEVVGDGGILIDPYDSKELAYQLENLLTNESLRLSLSKRALDRSSLFSWEKTAKQTLALYREVARE